MCAVMPRRKRRKRWVKVTRSIRCTRKNRRVRRRGRSSSCRNLGRGIDHVSGAIDRFSRAKKKTGSHVTREILDTNIKLLQVIRDDKKRLYRRRCSCRTSSYVPKPVRPTCRGVSTCRCRCTCQCTCERRWTWRDYLLGENKGYHR